MSIEETFNYLILTVHHGLLCPQQLMPKGCKQNIQMNMRLTWKKQLEEKLRHI